MTLLQKTKTLARMYVCMYLFQLNNGILIYLVHINILKAYIHTYIHIRRLI